MPLGAKELTSAHEAARSEKNEVCSQLEAYAIYEDIQIKLYRPVVSKVGWIQTSRYIKKSTGLQLNNRVC